MFLGIYDYTVILTYISLGISVFGITRALEGDFKVAIFCLALSGLCDMFDGKIARTKKNRTDDEKNFGIQIDSLCDVVCFGIFPAMICYCLGVNTLLLHHSRSTSHQNAHNPLCSEIHRMPLSPVYH